jgi:hypothetical protein
VSEELREKVAAEVEYELGRAIKDWSPIECADRILALLSAPEPPTEFARGVLAALTWYRNLPTDEERQQAADMIAGDPELQDIIARLNALVSAPEPAETGETLYPCAYPGCAMMRTKDEGGTTFTVCDKHWDEHYSRSPAPTAASEVEPAYTGDGTETLEGWVAPYSEGLWTFEQGEADPHPTMIRASLVLRGGATAAASEPADEAHCPICGHGTEPCAPDWCYRCEKPIAPTAAEPVREAPTPETERLFEAVLYGVRCGRGAVNDAACESIAREVIAALATPEAEGGSP